MSETPTTTTEDEFEFDFSGASGADAAREAFKNSQSSYNRLDFMKIDGSPAAVASGTNWILIRLLSEYTALPGQNIIQPWITVAQHSMVKTKPKPADHEGEWPSSMGAVCRNDKVFKARYGDCIIDDMPASGDRKNNRPSDRTWALAVLREEVIGDGSPELGGPDMAGKTVGVRDKTKEIAQVDKDGNPTGETKVVKQYIKINQGWKNFFAPLSGHSGRFKTALDRDYAITREGTGKNDTVFTITPMDPITFAPNHPKFPGRKFDLRDPEQVAEFYPDMPDLRKVVAEQASDEFYNRFFAPEGRLYGNGSKGESRKGSATAASEGPAAPAAPSTEQAKPSTDRLAALKNRIAPSATTTSAAPPASADVAEEQAEQPAESPAAAAAAPLAL